MYGKFKSIVIVHDYYRLDYIASGVSLLCKNLRKHVVFTGGLDSLNTPNSDSAKNLLLALLVASNSFSHQIDSPYLK
jgi:L-asparaginase/Glu-tRNA(Gln) amidotransferase subunit D